ncbi:MAG: sulfatase-like hydrolase/transferase [Planctomycetes bacterium]|nr:sulfatase-like hydrolase/transferase [Planctomycetota bacterium]
MDPASPAPRRRAAAALGLLLLAAAAGAVLLLRRPPSGPPPDIVLFVWDTCRADRLSALGHGRPTSPWLEEFAREGVLFERCFTPAPWTAPAHASLFTGLLPSNHGLRVGRGDRVRREVPLLAETLAARGYETVGVSANPHVSAVTGLDRGFRTFTKAWEGKGRKTRAEETAEAVRRTLEPILVGGRKPLFLFVNFLDPHMPHAPAAEPVAAVRTPEATEADLEAARGLSPELDLTLPFGGLPLGEGEVRGLRVLYDADVRTADAETGALLRWLRERGVGGDALVAVASDHGEALGEHGHVGHRLSIHEEVLRVPLAVRWPGRFDGGRRCGAMVSLMDLYPLLLEAAGAGVPAGNGADARVLSEEEVEGRVLLAEHGPNHAFLQAVKGMFPSLRDEAFEPVRWMFQAARRRGEGGERKLLRISRSDGAGGPWTAVRTELYDTTADPGEARDLLKVGGPSDAAEARALEALLPAPTMPVLTR